MNPGCTSWAIPQFSNGRNPDVENAMLPINILPNPCRPISDPSVRLRIQRFAGRQLVQDGLKVRLEFRRNRIGEVNVECGCTRNHDGFLTPNRAEFQQSRHLWGVIFLEPNWPSFTVIRPPSPGRAMATRRAGTNFLASELSAKGLDLSTSWRRCRIHEGAAHDYPGIRSPSHVNRGMRRPPCSTSSRNIATGRTQRPDSS